MTGEQAQGAALVFASGSTATRGLLLAVWILRDEQRRADATAAATPGTTH